MLLSPDDAEHFLRTYKDALQHIAALELKDAQNYVAVRGALYSKKHRRKPPTDDPDLLAALKTATYDRFVMGRHLKRGTEVVGPDNTVYRVKGITTELGDIVPPWVYVKTVVMRFRDQWICDGLIEGGNILIGPSMARDLAETIRAAKPPPEPTRKSETKRKKPPQKKTSMKEDPVREERIAMEAVVDAHDEGERALGWYYYVQNKLGVPFAARCVEVRSVSPLEAGEEVQVVGMPPEEECERELFVEIQWKQRKLAVPLSQLAVVKANAETKEAVTDWHYWVKQGYRF